MAMVGPILEEVLQIQHELKFTKYRIGFHCLYFLLLLSFFSSKAMSRFNASFRTAHGKERKQELGQHGSSWQPDIVGCTAGGKEVYLGELKGILTTKQDVNVDILRLTIFAKDALDHLHYCLVKDPPLLTFQSKGRAVVFFLAAKQGNAIVHARVSSIQFPSTLSELNLNQEFFSRLFQVQTLLGTTREYIKNKREKEYKTTTHFPPLAPLADFMP